MRPLLVALVALTAVSLALTSCQPKPAADEGVAAAPKAPGGTGKAAPDKPDADKPAESDEAGAGAMVGGGAGDEPAPPSEAGATGGAADDATATSGEVEWANSLEDALARAKAEDKLVVLDMAAEWCPPCKLLADEVWNSGDADDVLSKFVPVLVDVDANPEIGQKYGAASIPHICILDADGNKVDETIGYPGKEKMIQWLESKAR